MKKVVISILFLAINFSFYSQLVVDNTPTPEQLVEMLVGDGVVFSNVTFSGDLNQFGTFEQNGANIDMEDGLIMATGNCEFAIGPDNNCCGSDGGGNFDSGDPDLELLSGVGTNDAAILEFDFIPTGDFLSFEYVFASEEYPDFVCSTVNDAFGFFISGPGLSGIYSSPAGFPDGSTNIALIPGTDIGVSINTVNNGVSAGAVNNCSDLDPNWEDNVIYFIDNQNGATIQYDGMTVVLEAQANLICGELYHIKLAIADGGDTVWDSGVFLEANSFEAEFTQIVSSPTIDGSLYYNNDTILVEGCNIGAFSFFRGDTIGNDTINFVITGDTDDSDFVNSFPDFIVIESGEDFFQITVEAFADGIDEDLEELTLTYTYVIECTGDTVVTSSTIWLQDQVPPQIIANDASIFCEPIILAPTLLQGDGPFEWAWGILPDETTIISTDTQIISAVGELTTYWVTVSDPCFQSDSTTITVTLDDIPPIILTAPDYFIECPATSNEFTVNIAGGVEPFEYLWYNNETTPVITVFNQGSQTISVTVSDNCFQSETIEIPIVVASSDGPLTLVVDPAVTACPGFPATLVGNASGGFGINGYQYLWSTLSTETSISVSPTDLGINEYTLTIIDGCGGTTDAIGQVNVTFPPAIVLTTAEEMCVGLTTVLTTEGGLQPISITTSVGVHVDDNNIVTGSLPGVATITAFDGCGQTADVDILLLACEITIPNIFTPNSSPGENDFFVVDGLENFPNSKLTIFNRWGNIVYESSNYLNNWAATDVAGGVYYYILDRSDGKNFSSYVEVLK